MGNKIFRLSLIAASILLGGVGQANAFDSLTVLGVGRANGINDSGQVVGISNSQAILWNGTASTILGGLGGTSIAMGINSSGQVVGYGYNVGNTVSQAILWNGTTPTVLNGLGGANSFATGINNAGQVAGYSYSSTPTSVFSPLIWSGTTPSALGSLGGSTSTASAINNLGQSVGSSNGQATIWNSTTPTALGAGNAYAINNSGLVVGSSNSQAIVWNGATTSILGGLGGSFGSVASGINNLGLVVGVSYTASNAAHGMLWSQQNGVWVGTDLNTLIDPTLGFTIQTASAINSFGQVVGYGVNSLGVQSAYVMSVAAVPEPGEWLLMLCGLGLIGFIANRRKYDSSNMLMAAA